MVRPDDDVAFANRILLALSRETTDRLTPALEFVQMTRGQIVARAETLVTHCYFVNRGLVSLMKTMKDGGTVEIAVVGIEGVTDATALFGVIDEAMMEAVVQIPGTAFRIRTDILRHELERDPALRSIMQRYVHFFGQEIVQGAACNRLHSLQERCCRWLLIAQDNSLSKTFAVTHEFLAMMLGVQRAGVSLVAMELQRAGLVQYSRGHMTVIDRAGLEHASCECYAALQAQLRKLFGTRPGATTPAEHPARK